MSDLKANYRKIFKANLTKIARKNNALWLDYKIQNSLKTELERLFSTHKGKRPINLLLYYPLPIEFDSRKLLHIYKRKKGVQIFLPFMQGISFKIVKYRLPIQRGAFGVYESYDSSFKLFKLDYAIVPVIGMDKTFKRIGFGKGMYDRFFSTLKTKPQTIFICRALNLTHQKITQPYDLQADSFISPFATLKLKDIYNVNMGCYKFHYLRSCRWRG
ncbi:5-formyltetrahydrofolate cyclo-ligase [Helicobacter sp.]|uniref:5-formyltetrahydrofolate cyclo-ligase n=1 Tax=Helicobacter sp. TaxID=218 RepID=UPI0025C33266|nr:5-formyltetrahydrofolate cyclo-ligase [Helicobacter sp.]MCI5968141.1 5-formyltetrahydrofolate cyclo-ligase [Helicobacter sp.]MDY2585436.1 5-formyltetrahydrofolate cyclo-ligase [Helicobacter sp.]